MTDSVDRMNEFRELSEHARQLRENALEMDDLVDEMQWIAAGGRGAANREKLQRLVTASRRLTEDLEEIVDETPDPRDLHEDDGVTEHTDEILNVTPRTIDEDLEPAVVAVEEDDELSCDECDFTTESERGLAIHQGRAHADSEDEVSSNEYSCEDCDFETDTETGLNIHRGRVHESDTDSDPDGSEDGNGSTETDWIPDEDKERVEWTDYSAENAGNGTECQNCGHEVQKDFTRVFEPESEGGPRVCPYCTDLVRETDGTIREARSTAGVGGGSA